MATIAQGKLPSHAKLIITVLLFLQIAPVVMILQTAFKTQRSLLEFGMFTWDGWTLNNFYRLFAEQSLAPDLLNSIFIACGTMSLSVFCGSLMAYALTRWESKAKKHLLTTLLVARLLPPVALALPLFLVLKQFMLHDTVWGLILAHTALNFPLATWILMPFMDAVPRVLEEAAALDGASRIQTFSHVVLPVTKPGLVVAALFCFLMSWNDFLFSLILAGSQVKTAPLTLNGYVTGFGTEWGPLCAGACILLLPVFALSFKLHQHMIAAPTQGGVKGA
ncbi:MAG: carbohydrate ABC transporter permease [Betaproteobacteria bacterium]|nr:carbohydrate ABC transporter permease [Betaproteobacteria bacterium]